MSNRDGRKMPTVAQIAAAWDRPAGCCWRCDARCRPERAHLVAVMHDGTDDPTNLALLCRLCHAMQPQEFDDRAEAVAWLEDRSAGTADEQAVARLVDRLTVDDDAPAAAAAELVRRALDELEAPRSAGDAVANMRLRLLADALEARA